MFECSEKKFRAMDPPNNVAQNNAAKSLKSNKDT